MRRVPNDRCLVGWLLGVLLHAALWPLPSSAFANVEVGDPVANEVLPTLGSGNQALLESGKVSVFVFFRPGQEHSLDALARLAEIEREFAGKPVRFAAVVSASWPTDEVRSAVQASGIRMPVLVDRGDALYGKLGVRLHPVVGIVDQKQRLVAYQPFTKVNYGEVIRARIRRTLGVIDDAELARVLEPPRSTASAGPAHRYLNLAHSLLERKSYEKALEWARKSAEADPTLAEAQVAIGEALAGQGNCVEASKAFEAALKLEPGNAAAVKGKAGCGGNQDRARTDSAHPR